MDFAEFTAGKNDDGRRLDKIVRVMEKDFSMADIYKYLRKRLIRLNSKKASPDTRVRSGDTIQIAQFLLADDKKADEKSTASSVRPPEQEPEPLPLMEKFPLKIIFENGDILIVSKPYDIAVHGSKNALESQVRAYLSSASHPASSLSFSAGPLHRLDKKTSGLIAFSKSIGGARWFTENIRNHEIKKTYIAVVQGKITGTQEWCDYILAGNEGGKRFHTVKCTSRKPDSPLWKDARLQITPVGYGTFEKMDVTLAEIRLFTGRKHQIRAQCALHGHALLGDTAYGGTDIRRAHLKRDFYLEASGLILPQDAPFSIPQKVSIAEQALEEHFFDIIKYCDIKRIGV